MPGDHSKPGSPQEPHDPVAPEEASPPHDPDATVLPEDGDGGVHDAPSEYSSATQAAQHPDQIGPFRIIKRLGAGGMGAVYLAEQKHPVERRVALKLVHASLRSPEAHARFTAERHAMGRLSHPNVAALYEAGATAEGFPYFAMELVPGQPLTDYCDNERLGLNDRLDLLAQICAGVQHAHQKGIIHRDIKPGNLLVADEHGQPVPKVIDFGIAKALDEPLTEGEGLTRIGTVGTPAYSSPEALAGGSVDTRTDVYSLGVVLYQLLTGRKPNEPAEAVSRFAVTAQWVPPPRPSQALIDLPKDKAEKIAARRELSAAELVTRVRGDLDWIVMKAIAEEPEHRYGSAADLAADIERHLADEPVLARPPTARYRIRKFVRRNRVAVFASGVTLLALVAGIVGTTTGMIQARKAEAEARAQAERADNEALAATQVSDFLTELFNVSDPGEARGRTITARELLDRGSVRIGRGLSDQPLVRARLMGTISDVYDKLSQYDQAVALAEEALALREAQLGSEHPHVADSLNALGELYRRTSRYEDAERAHRRALAIRQSAYGADDPFVAESTNNLAAVLSSRGHETEAESLYRQALASRVESLGPDHPDVADSRTHLGFLLAEQERFEESNEQLTRALAIREQALGQDHYLVADTLNFLGSNHILLGEYEYAQTVTERALTIYRQVLDPGHSDIARSLLTLGTLKRLRGQPEEAAALQRRAGELFEQSLGPDDYEVARGLYELALTSESLAQWQEASQAYLRALAIYERVLGKDDRFVGRVLNNLGYVLSDHLRRYEEGEQILRRSVAIFAAGNDPDDYWNALSRWSLANNLRDQKRYDDAEPYFRQTLDMFVRTGGSNRVDNPNLAELVADYGKLLRATGRDTEAVALEARIQSERP